MNIFQKISYIAEVEFSDIVEIVEESEDKLRIYLKDGSFIDIWFSMKIIGRYAYHWERSHIDGKIYRHDNIPHKKWEYVKTFPKHFHCGFEKEVTESLISNEPEEAIREFLIFGRKILQESVSESTTAC